MSWLRHVIAVAALALAGLANAQATYILGPGDSVRVFVAGLPGSESDATVDLDGFVTIPTFGKFSAVGLTVDELQSTIRDVADSSVIRRYAVNGDLILIKPSPEEIYVAAISYHPIFIGGDVSRPGQVEFQPGMTVRSALAIAGGISTVTEADGMRVLSVAQVLNEERRFKNTVIERAVAELRLWRINQQLSDDPIPAPDRTYLEIPERLYDQLLAEQNSFIEAEHKTIQSRQAYLERALEQARDRVRILELQQERQGEAVESVAAELKRLEDLLKSGLAPASRIANARESEILAATRLLDLEENYARAKLDVTRWIYEQNALLEDRRQALLTERDRVRSTLLEIQQQYQETARILSLSGSTIAEVSPEGDVEFEVVIYRRKWDQTVESVRLDMDEMLQPADTIEVTILEPELGEPIQ